MLRVDYELIAACPSEPQALSQALKSASFKHVPSPIPIPLFNHCNGGSKILSRTFWAGLRDYFRFRRRWVEYIKSQSPDLVIVNSAVMVLMGPIIRRAGTKSLCLVRETFPPKDRSIRTRLLCRLMDKNFDGVLFLSEHDQRFAGLSQTKTGVVKDCARPGSCSVLGRQEACMELGIPEETFNILYTGGYSWIKGLDVALRSLSHLDYKDIRLIVAGDVRPAHVRTSPTELLRWILNPRLASFASSVTKLLEGRAIADRLVVLGTQSNMAQCYSAADVVLFPSNLPHQARPIFESGLYSLPVIISDYDENRESIEHDINGLTFKPRSAEGLACAIATLYEDRPKARRLGERNRVLALKEHAFEVEKTRLLTFVRDLLSS